MKSRLVCRLVCALMLVAFVAKCIAGEAPESDIQRARPDIPPLLEFADGTPVRTLDDLERRRDEIRRLFRKYFLGEFPAETPKLLAADILEEVSKPDGSTRRRIKLTFDTPHKASFEMWVWHPQGEGPFPLLLTQPRYYQIYWAEDALKRGYAVCLYPGLDCHHQEPDYPDYQHVWQKFQAEYPDASWHSSLGIQAWLASRALDYLLAPQYGQNIENSQVGILGFSRYGKQSLYAAAFDPRFTAVVARSSGTPASVAYRFAGRPTFAESISDAPAPWARPELREFEGRENELPVEGPSLLALIAPRHCLLHTAHNDGSDPTFGVEQGYLQGREVYRFLEKPERFRNIYRPGNHSSGPAPEEISAADRKVNLDWFDLAFDRGTAKQEDFPEVLLHQFDWNGWKKQQPAEEVTSPFSGTIAGDDAERVQRIRWMLGETPTEIAGAGEYHIKSEQELAIPSSERDRWACANTARMPVSFSGRIHGNVYYNPTIQRPMPAVIWLHPYSYGTGSNECYGVEDTTIYHRLAQQGVVVLAYDQCGFGERLLEGCDFYRHYPRWSRLGRMVYDVSRAVDFLIDGKGISTGKLPPIDTGKIYVLGYSLGGMVGLHATALDSRIAGVASYCGFTPLRTNTDDRPTGGNQVFYQLHALQPKLGLFVGKEQDIPYEYDDLLRLIAPRPCLIYAPTQDRLANADEVAACVERARDAWQGKPSADGLTRVNPHEINRFQKDQHLQFVEWISRLTQLR